MIVSGDSPSTVPLAPDRLQSCCGLPGCAVIASAYVEPVVIEVVNVAVTTPPSAVGGATVTSSLLLSWTFRPVPRRPWTSTTIGYSGKVVQTMTGPVWFASGIRPTAVNRLHSCRGLLGGVVIVRSYGSPSK